MRKKTDREMAIHEAKKLMRSAIRLKYAILAERELNDRLPEIEKQVNRAFNQGEEFTLDPATLYELEPS